MTTMHHTASREEWRKRFEQRLISLTEGQLDALLYFQLSREIYEIRFDDLPEAAAADVIQPPDTADHHEANASCAAIAYLRRFRLSEGT